MDELMASLTPGQIFLVCIGALMALAGLVNTVGAAFDRVKKWRQDANAPNQAQDLALEDLNARLETFEKANLLGRLKNIEDWQSEAKGMLSDDKRSLEKINAGLEASFQVQLALLDHALHGNNMTQMQTARDGLYGFLTHHKKNT